MPDLVSAVQQWLAAAPQEVQDALLGSVSTPNSNAHPEKKRSKSEVNYRKADGPECCGNCVHFHDNSCDVVAGNIKDDYVSDSFAPNEEAASEPADASPDE